MSGHDGHQTWKVIWVRNRTGWDSTEEFDLDRVYTSTGSVDICHHWRRKLVRLRLERRRYVPDNCAANADEEMGLREYIIYGIMDENGMLVGIVYLEVQAEIVIFQHIKTQIN